MTEAEHTVEDRLREEYFNLLPEIHRVADRLEAEISISCCQSPEDWRHERLAVKSRVKSCKSALEKLRTHQETGTFRSSQPEIYTLTSLNDLAGVRVLAFPRNRLMEVDRLLRENLRTWTPDPVEDDGEVQAFKYYGYCQASDKVRGEYQVFSMLTGLFWEVEHSAIYKPDARLSGIADHRAACESAREMSPRRSRRLRNSSRCWLVRTDLY